MKKVQIRWRGYITGSYGGLRPVYAADFTTKKEGLEWLNQPEPASGIARKELGYAIMNQQNYTVVRK